jgi:pyruvate dehydrogenase E2 component (dihydrolipoamide acetyltransferase)
MAVELKMPALSPTMEKGTLARWLVKAGDAVRPGDLLAEIETDKATMEFEAADEGRIASLEIADGADDVPVGSVIAILAQEGDEIDPPAAASAPDAGERKSIEETRTPARPIPRETDNPRATSDAARETVAPPPAGDNVRATPLARRIAGVEGISLDAIGGSGPQGKIVKADLGLRSEGLPVQAGPLDNAAAPVDLNHRPPAGVPVETVKLSTMRKTIARRLSDSKRTVPHFYLTVRCNLDPLLKLRGELNAAINQSGVKLSVNDLLIKAMALAMSAVPDTNVQFGGDVLHRFKRVDISMAVAIDGGLVTPVIRDAASLSLSAIAAQTRALASSAREGRLQPEDYHGGTASISNLGMFGIDEMFPVINPPQGLILGIGAGIEQPWKIGHEIAFATIFAATASFDHRAIDGAVAARFMATFRDLVETPLRILA